MAELVKVFEPVLRRPERRRVERFESELHFYIGTFHRVLYDYYVYELPARVQYMETRDIIMQRVL